jgi:hypothetical protein
MYTSSDVRAAFEQATGDRLIVHERSELTRHIQPAELLSFTRLRENPDGTVAVEYVPKEMESRYGDFTIFVFDDKESRAEHLNDELVSEDSVFWHRETPERGPDAYRSYWVAEKPFGANVLLVWASEAGRRETSEQWDRLVRALAPLSVSGR